jgi:hypothetical protein
MKFYRGGTQGGLVIYLMAYQHLLKYGMLYDATEKPLGQEILTIQHKNHSLKDAVVGLDPYNSECNCLVINQKLKIILDEYKLPEHFRYSVTLDYKTQHHNYTILYFDRPKLLSKYRYEAIDYELSIFTNEKDEQLVANNWQELENYPDGFDVRELYLRKNHIDYDLLPDFVSSPYSTGDSMYIISERLKLRLEKEKIKGLNWNEHVNTPWLKIV